MGVDDVICGSVTGLEVGAIIHEEGWIPIEEGIVWIRPLRREFGSP